MDESNIYDWIPFYQEFADVLVRYQSNRAELLAKLKAAYEKIEIPFPKINYPGISNDIDPITAFGLFNRKMSSANRLAIMDGIAKEFGMKQPVPSESLAGIPVLFPLTAVIVYDVSSKEMDRFWDMYSKAISFADNPSSTNKGRFVQAYDLVKDFKGMKFRLTYGLYWSRPNRYLNLDGVNRRFMTDPKNISQEIVDLIANLHDSVPKGEQYVNVCDRVLDVVGSNSYKYNDLPSLSHEAWLYGQQISLAKKGVKETDESEEEKEEQTKTRYWLYSPGRNASYWEECVDNSTMVFGFDEIGDLKRFHSQKEMQEAFRAQDENPKSLDSYAQSAHMTWEFLNVLKQGDVVFVKKGRSKIIGRGIVSSDEYNYDSSRPEYKSWRDVKWTHKGEWDYIEGASAPMKTLTDMTPYVDICNTLKSLFEDSDGGEPDSVVDPVTIEEIPPYSRADFLRDVFMTDADYETLVGLLKAKKNVVLQGAPGVGKTFIADRLAYSIMGEKNKSRVMTVQFHQSYSYEDFIMGYRPTESGFKLNHGAFYDFCKKAEIDPDSEYFFIIDEINRGNMSKIFGELFMLVEADKRGKELRLLYSNELFSVPKNVYLIGTMNTADRSLALLDYALRRRFAFFEVSPGFASGGFGEYRARLNNPRFDALVARVEALNREIAEDPSLGKGFSVGHSYFCGLNPENVDARLPQIVEYELVPLLAEYWFDEPKKVEEQARKLRDALR